MVCFDKTGTLTEDGLDVLGARIVTRGKRFVYLHILFFPAVVNAESSGFLSCSLTLRTAFCSRPQVPVLHTTLKNNGRLYTLWLRVIPSG